MNIFLKYFQWKKNITAQISNTTYLNSDKVIKIEIVCDANKIFYLQISFQITKQ